MRPFLPTLAFLVGVACASPARAQALDPDFPFSTGPAPARAEAINLPYTPTIQAYFPAEVEEAQRTRLLGFLSQHLVMLPPAHRALLHQVVFDPGGYPRAQAAAARFKTAKFTATAIALPQSIVFYRNPPSPDWTVTRGVVFHEMGHVLAMAKFGASAPPAAWTEAARSDGMFFTQYSRNAFNTTGTLVEDFADAYANFVGARYFGGEDLTAFQATYPARYRLLESYAY